MTTAEGHERTPRGAEASGRSFPRKLSEGTGNTMTTMALGSATAAIAPRIQLGRGVGAARSPRPHAYVPRASGVAPASIAVGRLVRSKRKRTAQTLEHDYSKAPEICLTFDNSAWLQLLR